MVVELISYTKPVKKIPAKTTEEYIAYVARVSNPSNQDNSETASKLVNYLMKHKHWSPLEMVDITLEIQCTRDIARQILRHRSFSFQEFCITGDSFVRDLGAGVEYSEARLQDNKNRQNSIESDDDELQSAWLSSQKLIFDLAIQNYNEAIKHGIAKEIARKVMPEGLTMSRLYMKGSLRSWIHYIQVRMHESTQKEHREVAKACMNEINTIFKLEGHL